MTNVNTEKWKEFPITELFTIVKGTRLTRANMKEGSRRFIGASATNNGITNYVGNDTNIHPGNVLTVAYNGSVGETFYQDQEFLATDDVNVLYPKFKMTKEIGLFLAPIIKATGRKYKFIDKWKIEDMEKDSLKLPAAEGGSPDWEYMQSYMESILDSCSKIAKIFKEIQ